MVIVTEMDLEKVGAGPHTPALVESSANYALGAYITTILAQWFGGLGYRAVAHHNRHYDLLLVPPAVDAGLGELGRHGYLVALLGLHGDLPFFPAQPLRPPDREMVAPQILSGPEASSPPRQLVYGKKWKPRAVAPWVQYFSV